MLTAVHILVFVLGGAVVAGTLSSAIHTVVLPRGVPDRLTRVVFLTVRRGFDLRAGRVRTYEDRDRVMALYSPISLMILLVVWLALVELGYTGMFWALGGDAPGAAFTLSGSSLLTLGFAPVADLPTTILVFSEATIGLILVALLIAYLPSMYSAFSRREALVTMLGVRAGAPPSAVELFQRYHRIGNWTRLTDLWMAWEVWFVELEETHTSYPALAFFRSPQSDRSWITAAGAVLDAAALTMAAVDLPREAQAALCLRAGFLALRRIADFFGLPYAAEPAPDDPISVTRQEFNAAWDELAEAGIPLKADRDQAWRDFKGWRVNYDAVLLSLCGLVMPPYARWSSDRGVRPPRPPIRHLHAQ